MDVARFKNTLLLQRKPLLIGAGVFGAALLLLGFGAYPLWGSIETVQTNLKQEEQALAKIRQRASLVSNITPEDTKKFEIVASSLPTQKEPLAAVAQLQNIAQEARVTLGKYDVNPGLISTGSGQEATTSRRSRNQERKSSSQYLDLETEFSGTFPAIRGLIVLLEHARPVLEIQTLSLDPEKKVVGTGSASLRYVAKIGIRSYFASFDPKTLVSGGAQALNKEQEKTFATLESMRSWLSPPSGTVQPGTPFVNTDIFGMGSAAPSPSPTLRTNPETDEVQSEVEEELEGLEEAPIP